MRSTMRTAVLAICLLVSPLAAGEHDQLLGQLQELQGKLSSLQTKLLASSEKASNQAEQMPARPSNAGSSDQQAAITALTRQVALLRDQVAKLTAVNTPSGSDSLMMELLADLALLKEENGYLRMLLGESEGSQEIASLDGETAVPQRPTLMNQLQELNSRLDRMINNSPLSGGDASSLPNGLSIGGFVKATNKNDHNTNNAAFSLEQVEVDLRKSVGDRAAVRADVEVFGADDGSYELFLEQGFVSYSFGSSRKVTFDLGKFNSPLGLEGVDPTDIKEVTQTKLTAYALPTNLTGVRASTQVAPAVGVSLFVANGWDLNVDNNRDKTYGAQLTLAPMANLNLTVGGIMGPEQEDNVSFTR